MSVLLVNGNALSIPLADNSVHMVVTSPPYFSLRDYQVEGQLGMEDTFEEYVENMVAVFREVWRVLRPDGTLFLNLGDSYAGSNQGLMADGTQVGGEKQLTNKGSVTNKSKRMPRGSGRWGGGDRRVDTLKPKDLIGIPWRVAFALQADGWWLRSDIIWHKPNPMPESVTDRPTKSHEYLFLLSKSASYYYDADAIREPHTGSEEKYESGRRTVQNLDSKHLDQWTGGRFTHFSNPQNPAGRNRRTVWTIPTAPYSGAHFATYPPALVEPCIKAGTSERGCCPACGKPWERVTEKGEPILNAWSKKGPGNYNFETKRPDPIDWDGGSTLKHSREHFTTGWQPGCTCAAGDAVPCTVFDPFAGSGTTLMVARSLGRDAVGLDLSYAYLHEQARARLELDRLEAWQNGIQAGNDGYHDLPMFQQGVENA